jgi:preprotein translocase subunit YajC
MHLNFIPLLADAAAPAGTSAQQQGSPFGLFVPMILVFVILYFMMIRPQSQRAKKQAELQKNLKSNDRVVTSSGIVGIIISVKDTTVSLRSADTKMEVTRNSILEVLKPSEEKSEKPA